MMPGNNPWAIDDVARRIVVRGGAPDVEDAARTDDGRRRNQADAGQRDICTERANVIAGFVTKEATVRRAKGRIWVDENGRRVGCAEGEAFNWRGDFSAYKFGVDVGLKHQLFSVERSADGMTLILGGRPMSVWHAVRPTHLAANMRRCMYTWPVNAIIGSTGEIKKYGSQPMRCNAPICPMCAASKYIERKAEFALEMRDLFEENCPVWWITLGLGPGAGMTVRRPVVLTDAEAAESPLPPPFRRATLGDSGYAVPGNPLTAEYDRLLAALVKLRHTRAWTGGETHARMIEVQSSISDGSGRWPQWTLRAHVLVALLPSDALWPDACMAAWRHIAGADAPAPTASRIATADAVTCAASRIVALSPGLGSVNSYAAPHYELTDAQLLEFECAMKGRRPFEVGPLFSGGRTAAMGETDPRIAIVMRTRARDPQYSDRARLVYRAADRDEPNETHLPEADIALQRGEKGDLVRHVPLTVKRASKDHLEGKRIIEVRLRHNGRLEDSCRQISPTTVLGDVSRFQSEAVAEQVIRGRRRRDRG